MRVEVLKNLKGETTWKKGTVFDDTVSPIPRDIMGEVAQGASSVRVLSGPKEIEVTDLTPNVDENFQAHVPTLVPGMQRISDEITAMAETPVVAETDNASFITQEKPIEHLPELEGLIHAKGTIAAVANLLDTSYPSITRWRKGSNPKPAMLKKIKREYAKLRSKDDQSGTDDAARAGIEGSVFQPG